jgi:hypothetical protein
MKTIHIQFRWSLFITVACRKYSNITTRGLSRPINTVVVMLPVSNLAAFWYQVWAVYARSHPSPLSLSTVAVKAHVLERLDDNDQTLDHTLLWLLVWPEGDARHRIQFMSWGLGRRCSDRMARGQRVHVTLWMEGFG